MNLLYFHPIRTNVQIFIQSTTISLKLRCNIFSHPCFIEKEHSNLTRKSTPRFVSLPERGMENIKYFLSSSGNRTHNLLHLRTDACASVPRLACEIFCIFYFINKKVGLEEQVLNLSFTFNLTILKRLYFVV